MSQAQLFKNINIILLRRKIQFSAGPFLQIGPGCEAENIPDVSHFRSRGPPQETASGLLLRAIARRAVYCTEENTKITGLHSTFVV